MNVAPPRIRPIESSVGRTPETRSPQRWVRPALAVPLVASALVHVALAAGLLSLKLQRPERLTDVPGLEVALALPPPQAAEPAMPVPPPPPPPPMPTADAPPVAETPPIEPVRVSLPPEDVPPPALAPPNAARRATTTSPAGPAIAAPASEAGGPVAFAGVTARRASRVVYAVDASGAMTTSLPLVLEELERSVARLTPDQSFQVVFFREPAPGERDDGTIVLPTEDGRPGLLRAGAEASHRLGQRIADLPPHGRSDPLIGLERALEFKPQVVFLLCRSIRRSGPHAQWGQGLTPTLRALDRLNPRDATGRRPVAIKTIQFLDDDPTGLLEAIAATHGDGEGSYRVLSLEQLGAVP